jgi:uncharacterized protein (DUF58 family)
MSSPPGHWRPTGALGRALVTAAGAVAVALLAGDPSLVVLAAPFVVLAVPALLLRPRREPRLWARLDHRVLHEGQGTTSRLTVSDAEDVEYLTRVVDRASYVALQPQGGRVGALRDGPDTPVPDVQIGPRRWGRRVVGDEVVAMVSPWAGYRFGPVELDGSTLTVLPALAPYGSRAEAPQPVGLVGAHRSRRPGSGTELAGIRPFLPGERQRRGNRRV